MWRQTPRRRERLLSQLWNGPDDGVDVHPPLGMDHEYLRFDLGQEVSNFPLARFLADDCEFVRIYKLRQLVLLVRYDAIQ